MRSVTRWNKTPALDKVESTLPCLPCKLHGGLRTDALQATYHLFQEHTFKIIEEFLFRNNILDSVFPLSNNSLPLLIYFPVQRTFVLKEKNSAIFFRKL
jgi:hypothetical protein